MTPRVLLTLFVCCCVLPLSAAPDPAPKEAAPVKTFGPPQDSVWKPIPHLTDEFEGTALDAAKWYPRNPGWQGRQPAWFSPGNVTVSDGKLHLVMRKETLPNLPAGYHTYTSAAVKSRSTVLYGYFEIRAKPMRSHGSSAFWFYDSTPEIWTEIDMFEMGAASPGHERVVHMNAHVFHTPTEKTHWAKGSDWTAPFDLADDYHVYALNWSKEKLEYLVDGEVVRSMENTHWHQPLYLNFDSETMPEWFGLPKDEELPATFSVEYVRAWRKE
jgi:beta-glucanase (GH16 family)